MSRTALVAKNTLIQVVGRAAGTVFGLVTLGVMTRYLGVSGYGAFTTVTTFLQFFGILVDFGLSMTAVAMLSEPGVDRDKVAANLFTMRVVSAAGFFLLAPLASMAFPYPADVKAGIAVGALSFFLISVNQVLVAVLQKELRMGRSAAAEILGRAGLLLAAWSVARGDLGLVWMIGALVVGNLLTAFWNWLLVRDLVRVSWRFDRHVWAAIIRKSWPIGMSIAFNLIYLKGDVIVLSLTRSQAEVGLYGAAYKVLDVLTVVPIMFMGLVLPLLVKARHVHGEFRRILQKSFDFMAIMALPIVVGAWSCGRDLMRLLAGSEFTGSGTLLDVLIIAGGAVFFGSLFGHAVVAVEKQRVMVWGYAIDAIVAGAAYIILIPRYGATAGAWITVFSEAFIAIGTFIVVRRTVHFRPTFGIFARATAAAATMGIVVALIPSSTNVLIRVAVGTVVYAGCAFLYGAVTRGHLRELLPKRDML